MKHNFTLDFSSESLDQNLIKTKYSNKESIFMITGVTVISSDSQDEIHQDDHISSIKKKLQQFKERKAKQIVTKQKRTKETIHQIVYEMKNSIENQALQIIKTSIDSQQKIQKEDISTIPSFTNSKSKSKDSDFVTLNCEDKQVRSRNQREFTLGQKNRCFSNKNQRDFVKQPCQVSEFHCLTEQANNIAIKPKLQRFSDLYKHR